jgi:hypothetical protein
MADFTQSIPEPIADLPTLAGLLKFWNEEVCKKTRAGKSFIYGVVLATDGAAAGKNVVFFKDTESEPLEPKLLKDFPGTLSDDEVENQIAGIEEKENLVVRSYSIVLLGGEKKWVAFFDAAPAVKSPEPTTAGNAPAGNMTFDATRKAVSNRGQTPVGFLRELVAWGKAAPPEIFEAKPPPPNETDVYASVQKELGPYGDPLHRKACMLEVMRVLAGFESSWKWEEGRDTKNTPATAPQNEWEAGAFQVSSNSIGFGQDLRTLVVAKVGSTDASNFQAKMKQNHELAMEYIARLLRHTIRHNGPVVRKEINSWLSKAAVEEFKQLLAT